MSMDHPTPTALSSPSAVDTPTPTATTASSPDSSAFQETATIENYAANKFFPNTVVVVRDVPLKLYVTRLHTEHVNRFDIEPLP